MSQSRSERPRTVSPSHWRRVFIAVAQVGLLAAWMMGGTACGMNAQTTRPYTPAEGVNLNVGDVQVRNLLIISAQPGEGIVSATLTADSADQLVAVTGKADAMDGDGEPLTGEVTTPVDVHRYELVKLTDRPPVIVRSPALRAGLTATLQLRFRDAGKATIRVPVVDDDISYYETIKPLAP